MGSSVITYIYPAVVEQQADESGAEGGFASDGLHHSLHGALDAVDAAGGLAGLCQCQLPLLGEQCEEHAHA